MSTSHLEETLRIQIVLAGLPEGEAEVRVKRGRRWRFDRAWPERKVAVEVEGGVWSGGRHTRGSGFEADCIKYSEAALLGWRVIRVTGGMVVDGRALALIARALADESDEGEAL